MPQTELSPALRWTDYWNKDTLWAQSRIWEINARLFTKKVSSFLKIAGTDQVLDIGCGSGYTAEQIAPLTGSYLGIDCAANLLTLASARCGRFPHAFFMEIPAQAPDFTSLGKFSLFLCVSVIQYYPNAESILEMVRSASKCALPGARMLIADIPQPRIFFRRVGDFTASLAQSVQEGYIADYLKLLFHLPFSHYRKFSAKNSILEIPAELLQKKISELGFKVTLITTTVSICTHRPSLLIQF